MSALKRVLRSCAQWLLLLMALWLTYGCTTLLRLSDMCSDGVTALVRAADQVGL